MTTAATSSRSGARNRRRRTLRAALGVVGVALALAGGCARTPYTRAIVPRPDQQYWVDERQAMEKIPYFNYSLSFTSRHDKALLGYANLLRSAYERASLGGRDVDAGIRVLNFLHRIHRQARGSRAAWREVLEKAGQPRGTEGLRGIPIPRDYR